uniref:Uncharacterized protein n=1 Tax=Acrobeloides nanus TaxID=290746 RepID=A0A914E742_9BILA
MTGQNVDILVSRYSFKPEIGSKIIRMFMDHVNPKNMFYTLEFKDFLLDDDILFDDYASMLEETLKDYHTIYDGSQKFPYRLNGKEALLFIITKACDFNLIVVSNTGNDYFIQIKTPNGTASELFHFKKSGQKESVHITGNNCFLNMTSISTYKVNQGGSRGQRLYQAKAILDGMGFIQYSLLADGQVAIDSSTGVLYAFDTYEGKGKK